MQYCFITRANAQIGAGHIRRCQVIADSLLEKGHAVFWYVDTISAQYLPLNARIIKPINDKFAHYDWVICDDYAHNADFERAIDSKLCVISDGAHRLIHANIILNHNPNGKTQNYQPYNSNNAKILAGLDYCLIPKQITQIPSNFASQIRHILVNFGMGQFAHWHEILQYIAQNPDYQFRIITDNALNLPPNAHIAPFTPNIAEHYEWADAAIGAGGVSAMERAFCGINSLNMAIVDNQIAPLHALHDMGLCQLLPHINDLLQFDLHKLHPLHHARTIIDGRGVERVIEYLT